MPISEYPAPGSGGGSVYDPGTWVTVGSGGGAPAFVNGWAASTASSLQYRKDSNGVVWIRGQADGSGATSPTVFTLPVGFRPSQREQGVSATTSPGSGSALAVTTTGVVQNWMTGSGGSALDDPGFTINFFAA